MSEHPILFSAPMVRAIIEGRKTQTRRVVKPQPDKHATSWVKSADGGEWKPVEDFPSRVALVVGEWVRCPYGRPGDLLWVRETWREAGSIQRADGKIPTSGIPDEVYYYADDKAAVYDGPWRSSIHMPRWASRLTLRITDVRVQRVQEISEADAFDEGISGGDWLGDPVGEYAKLWDSINGKRAPWASNPFCWALTFVEADAGVAR
jgi:hypothetical protein